MFPIEARFTGKGGWRTQAETAAEHLTVGEIYTVLRMDVGRSSSHLVLVDFPDLQFNTVMFEGVPSRYADECDDAEAPPADPATVPDEIRKAAHHATILPLGQALRTSPYELIDLAVDAIYPLIVATERKRDFVLVWRNERGQEICRSSPLHPGIRRIGIPLDAQHADLIREDDSDA